MKVAPEYLARHTASAGANGHPPSPSIAILSNGRYSVQMREAGSGVSTVGGRAVTRWRGDDIIDEDGIHIYLRDLSDGSFWSAGFQPTRARPSEYQFSFRSNFAQIERLDFGIACKLRVLVLAEFDMELRVLELTNQSSRTRRIELTSYLEWVLGPGDADANHPAFSKLFVETEFCRERSAIVARRRPRSHEDAEFFGLHAVLPSDSVATSKIEFETNRARFIGRGRTQRNPIVLESNEPLRGDVGPVLDPIGSLRLVVSLRPGETKELAYVVGASTRRSGIDEMLHASALQQCHDSIDAIASGSVAEKGTVVTPTSEILGQSVVEVYRPAGIDSIVPTHSSNGQKVGAKRFENPYGAFSNDGREYIIHIRPHNSRRCAHPPMPWVNVVANEQAGFIISENGAGCTWAGNSRTNRLTAWHNDPISDPHSEAIWVRDEVAGEFWSVTPGPTPSGGEYQVRHGFGYSVFQHASHGLSHELAVFMVRDQPLKIARMRLTNLDRKPRPLSVFSFAHWALNGLATETAIDICTTYDEPSRAIFATNPHRDVYSSYVAFSSVAGDARVLAGAAFTCDRREFVGLNRDLRMPAALVRQRPLERRAGREMDSCAAWQIPITLAAGETIEFAFLLGEVAGAEDARASLKKYSSPAAFEQAFNDVQAFWQNTTSAISIETPSPELDILVNGWLPYQNLSCRMWARSAFYQPGGAFGFRDQLQDSAALIYHSPELTRTQILRHAAKQFPQGDVLHWWHPDSEYGLRTRFSDDLLWLPLVTAEYIHRTGDRRLLDENVPFVEGQELEAGEQEAYLRPSQADFATLYDHCCRALDRGLTTGPHGLPLIGCGDWNDGLNRVGVKQRGESVWLGFFIAHVLQQFLPLCAAQADDDRLSRYTAYRERLIQTLDSAGWDGGWYRRAYYDDGQILGSAASDECQIDALAQAWAVISGVASPERAKLCLQAVEDHLVSNDVGIIRLLTPAFDHTPNDPGYIKGYLPGIRENGGQYTHGVLWFVKAMAESGHGSRAVELLRMLTPIWHTRNEVEVLRYQTEPYVVAADVYGEQPHVGRGGWTWYTGSAGWMFRVAVESILGFGIENGDTIVMNPSISADWNSCRLVYRVPGERTSFDIRIENPQRKQFGVASATLDGRPVPVVQGAARIPLARDHAAHHVVVRL